jgi:O2-independent ubiquinone biosynthesis protein UbiV
MKLTLGPILYHWSPERFSDFYARIADEAPVDRVCLGEAVCSKRAPFTEHLLREIAERLARASKEVVLSSLALVATKRERRILADLVASPDSLVEINDPTGFRFVGDSSFGVGPFLNVYNEATLAWLEERGTAFVCLPPELPLAGIREIARASRKADVEVWAFGRLPLAISARCYHARLSGLTKDGCQFVCERDPDGLPLTTMSGQPFLTVNGVQTLSHTYASALNHLDALRDCGVASLRLSPQDADMVVVSTLFRDALDGRISVDEAHADLGEICAPPLSNGFLAGVAGYRFESRVR